MLVGDISQSRKANLMRNFYLLSFGIGALILATDHAQAQTRTCARHAQVVERLAAQYGERRQSIGLGAGNVVVETYASDSSGTWTITVTTADGLTCLVAAGRAFEITSDPLLDTNQGL